MKKMFWLILAVFIYYPSAAQEVTVKEYEDNDEKGFLIFLEKDPKVVGDFINKYFKSYGNVRYRNDIYLISDLNHPEFPFPEIEVYSNLKKVNGVTKASVWLADSIMAQDVYADKLEGLWHVFAVDFYKSLKQQEIDESFRALRYAEKQFQRLEKDSLSLQKSMTKNIAEKAKLEEELRNNALNYGHLLEEIDKNVAAKDSVLITLDKIKRLIEVQEREKKAIE